MRKYDGKNKRNIGIIIAICLIFAVIFSYFLFQQIKLSKIRYELESNTVLLDEDKNTILLKEIGIIKKKWNRKYYLTYKDEQHSIGSHVIAYNINKISLNLYGEFYEIFSNSEVEITKEETILNNLGISRFYKIADRKYLLVDPNIKTEDESLKTINYLIVELDKQGNAILYNNNLNVKVFSASKIITTGYTFDIANELIIYDENTTVDLKKILGTTNEYKKPEEKPSGNDGNELEDDKTTGTGDGGTGGNGGTGNNAGNNNVVDTNQGNTNDVITKEEGTEINKGEIINQTANTSILRITPYIDSISVDYVIYDKTGEYLTTYVEIEGPNYSKTVHLQKNNTNVSLDDLAFGTTYKLTFKYDHYIGDLIREELIGNGSYYVTTLNPEISIVGTKVTSKKINYKVSSSLAIDSAVVKLYIDGVLQDVYNTSLNGENAYIDISNVAFLKDSILELRLEDIYISGAKVNAGNISWFFKTTTSQNQPPPDSEDIGSDSTGPKEEPNIPPSENETEIPNENGGNVNEE